MNDFVMRQRYRSTDVLQGNLSEKQSSERLWYRVLVFEDQYQVWTEGVHVQNQCVSLRFPLNT